MIFNALVCRDYPGIQCEVELLVELLFLYVLRFNCADDHSVVLQRGRKYLQQEQEQGPVET